MWLTKRIELSMLKLLIYSELCVKCKKLTSIKYYIFNILVVAVQHMVFEYCSINLS